MEAFVREVLPVLGAPRGTQRIVSMAHAPRNRSIVSRPLYVCGRLAFFLWWFRVL